MKLSFFSKLEMVLELKALSSPLATVNILMSLFQLGHFPGLVLHRVFSPSFISNVTSELEVVITECLFEILTGMFVSAKTSASLLKR